MARENWAGALSIFIMRELSFKIVKTAVFGAIPALVPVILFMFLVSNAQAQTAAASRSSAPSLLHQRVEPDQRAPRGMDIPLPEKAPGPEPAGSGNLVLSGVQIEGATVYPEAELAAIYEPYLGKLLSVADAEKIVAAITAKYQAGGYPLSRALAQPQDLEFGILRIDVIEGYIERVVFEGPVEARKHLLSEFAEKLKAARPLTQATLERYVMLMSDLPGLDARPAFRELDGASGAHELVLRLSQDDFEGYASIDNKSTRTVGRQVAQVSGNFNSLLGHYERSALYFYTVPENNRELMFLGAQQEYILNADGTIIGIDAWHSVSQSGEGNKALDLDSFDTRAAVYLMHPVIRSRELSLFLTGTFEYRNTNETTAGVEIYEDRVRSLRLTARGYFVDTMAGENILIATASQGIAIFDPTSRDAVNISRTGGRIDYRKIDGQYARYQALSGPWSAQLGLKGQLNSNGLLSAEEFRSGGGNFGRAYDPSEISGDYGAAAYLELQHNLAASNSFFRGTQIFVFYDLAAAWNNDPLFGTSKVSIASGGAGMRILLPKNLRITVEMARPLTEPVFAEGTQGHDTRLFVGLNISF